MPRALLTSRGCTPSQLHIRRLISNRGTKSNYADVLRTIAQSESLRNI